MTKLLGLAAICATTSSCSGETPVSNDSNERRPKIVLRPRSDSDAGRIASKNPFDKYDRSKLQIVPYPTEDEMKEWYEELAGDNPARQAAVKRWGGLRANYNENRFDLLGFRDTEVHGKDLADLNLFPEIHVLQLTAVKVRNDALVVISTLKHLRNIECEGTIVDNRFCEAVAQLPSLSVLLIPGAQIDNEGVAYLARTQTLTALNVNGSPITSDGLKDVSSLPLLDYLQIADTRIDDRGLKYVAKMRSLSWLEMDNTAVTDAGIEQLRSLDLVVLQLGNTKVTDRAVEVIAGMQKMTKVFLQNTCITNKSVHLLASLPKLGDELKLENTLTDDGCLEDLCKMTELNNLDLRGTKISRKGMETLRAALKKTYLQNDYGIPVAHPSGT